MSTLTDCGCGNCLCAVADTDCLVIEGKGTTKKSFSIEPVFDDDENNLAECNPAGFGAFLPSLIADPPRAKIIRATYQTIPSSTPILIVFDTEQYDSAGMVDIGDKPGRITIVQNGLYIVHLLLVWEEPVAEAYASSTVYAQPVGTGILTDSRYITAALGDPAPRLSVSNNAELDEGNYLVTQVFQNTGADLKLLGATMSARYVAPRT